MGNNYSIEVNNISKSFKVFLDKGHTLKEMTIFKKRYAIITSRILDKYQAS